MRLELSNYRDFVKFGSKNVVFVIDQKYAEAIKKKLK